MAVDDERKHTIMIVWPEYCQFLSIRNHKHHVRKRYNPANESSDLGEQFH